VKQPWRLVTPQGAEVPFQVLNAGLGIGEWNWGLRRLLVRASLKPGELLPLRCALLTTPPADGGTAGCAGGWAGGPESRVDTGAAPPLRSGPEGPTPPSSLRLLTHPVR
jgi:hypothetical protein